MDEIFLHFYPDETPLRALLWRHSVCVCEKALSLIRETGWSRYGLDQRQVERAALLHDIGVSRCHAPGIHCMGGEPYLRHGLIGGALLRAYGSEHNLDLEAYARVCERHTGSGLTAEEIREQGLPLPPRDFLPETPLEKLICYADKFFSKSGDGGEKPWDSVAASFRKFSPAANERLLALHALEEQTPRLPTNTNNLD